MRERPARGGEYPRTAILKFRTLSDAGKAAGVTESCQSWDSFSRRVIYAKVVERAADPRNRPGRAAARRARVTGDGPGRRRSYLLARYHGWRRGCGVPCRERC